MAACYGPFFAFVLFVILLLCLMGQTSRCDHLLGDERGGGETGMLVAFFFFFFFFFFFCGMYTVCRDLYSPPSWCHLWAMICGFWLFLDISTAFPMSLFRGRVT